MNRKEFKLEKLSIAKKVTMNSNKLFYTIVAVIALLMVVLTVGAFNSGGPPSLTGHTGEEILVDDTKGVGGVNLDTKLAGMPTSLLVKHSQSTTVPTCPAGWTSLWTGFSLAAAAMGGNADFTQTGTGTCAREFKLGVIITECGGGRGSSAICDFWTGDDYHTWLKALNADGTNPDGLPIGEQVSRCVVCEKQSPVLVLHSQSTTVPTCPAGWTALWNGFSYVGGHIGGSTRWGPGLHDPSSCLEKFQPNPTMECTLNSCATEQGDNFGVWLTARDGTDVGPTDKATTQAQISHCAVCSK